MKKMIKRILNVCLHLLNVFYTPVMVNFPINLGMHMAVGVKRNIYLPCNISKSRTSIVSLYSVLSKTTLQYISQHDYHSPTVL